MLLDQDDLKQAREKSEQALALQRDLKRAIPLAGSLVQSGEISLEEGKPADSEKMANEALHELESTASPARAAEAYSLRALALLAQNKKNEARDDAKLAGTLAAKASDRNPKYDAALAVAQVDLAEGKFAEARKQLAPVLSRPSNSVSVPYLFQARLTLGEIGLKSGQADAARGQLTSLEKQAREEHFLLIARKAGTLLAASSH